MSEKKFSRLEIAALKRMEKSLTPLKKQIERFDTKIKALEEERAVIIDQHSKIEAAMDAYAGCSYKEVLKEETPESGVVDESIKTNIREACVRSSDGCINSIDKLDSEELPSREPSEEEKEAYKQAHPEMW